MTLTLRLYDDTGTEIAFVTADPYEVIVTHPNPEEWSFLAERLRNFETVIDFSSLPPDEQDSNIRFIHEPGPVDLEPEEHLEYIAENVSQTVSSTEIVENQS